MQDARKLPQFNMRMPQDLKDWLATQAVANFRSLNSELIARLEESRKREETNHAAA